LINTEKADSLAAIFSWCDAKGSQVCCGSWGEERKRGRVSIEEIKKIAEIHNPHFLNITMIRILATELLNTILILVYHTNDKISP
jgi:hypothetical protein